jgi:nucleoside-diphosphate-sugar epimerase
MTTTTPRLFCFGIGYSAQALIDRLRDRGWRIAGTVRSEDKAEELRDRGVEVHLFDRGRPLDDPEAALAGATHLLSSVPPDSAGAGDAVVDEHGDTLRKLAHQFDWAGYLSTTGVYGDRDGGWVDETDALHPTSDRSRRRVAAETAWRELAETSGLPLHVFRLAGIYGPGRNPVETVRQGKAKRIDKPGQVFSRIHVTDIVNVLEASIARPNPGAIYNVCDDEPAAPKDVTEFACQLLGVDPPPLVPIEQSGMSEMGWTFWKDNKRVDNSRMHRELLAELAYPDYRTGLRALV